VPVRFTTVRAATSRCDAAALAGLNEETANLAAPASKRSLLGARGHGGLTHSSSPHHEKRAADAGGELQPIF